MPKIFTDPNLILSVDLAKHDGSTFMSDDQRGHLCTVTGATWEIAGRHFDTTDDLITITDNAMFSFGNGTTDIPFSIGAWVKKAETNFGIITKWGGATADREWGLTLQNTTVYLSLFDSVAAVQCYRASAASSVATGVWAFILATYDGTGGATAANGITLYVNGGGVSGTATNNAAYVAMSDTTTTPKLAGDEVLGAFNKGYKGDVFIWRNKVLSLSEGLHIYLATKWRYS